MDKSELLLLLLTLCRTGFELIRVLRSSRAIGRRSLLGLVAVLVVVILLGAFLDNTLGGQGHTTGISSSSSSLVESLSSSSSTSFRVASSSTPGALSNLTQYVNPFIGTGNTPNCAAACGGDTFPGASYPMGMVQWSPDTTPNPAGGYSYTASTIKDMSLTHFSGRGCNVYEDFPFMPYVGTVSLSPATHASTYYSHFSHANERARPGYYEVRLDGPNVTARLTVTSHTGLGEFLFPPSAASTLIVNAGGSINGNSNSQVAVISASNEVTGSAQSTVGCGSNPYTVYLAAKFDRPFASYGTWNGDSVTAGSGSSNGQHVGAFLVFDTTSNGVVRAQVGISFVSVANAESNLTAESGNFDLSQTMAKADAAWNNRLNSIRVAGGTLNETVSFYTSLYHVFFHPNVFNDANGQYIGFDAKVHTVPNGHSQYENIPGWDSYRTHIRLLSILDPAAASDISQSLVNDAIQGGGSLPRWEQANADSHGMSGDDGDVIIADAYTFGATNFDTSGALRAMLGGQSLEREGYAQYVKLGYVPADLSPGLSSASITLEYANDDFAIAQFAAQAFGNKTITNEYLQRSGNWMNLFNATSKFTQPRNTDGSWANGFSPTTQNGFQEGDSAQYTWMTSYDLRGLFDKMGGNQMVVTRLDTFLSHLNDGPESQYAWMGNEPSVEVPWEYDFAQAPSHAQDFVRRIQTQLWSNSPGGIPGNDDGGEMSSWYVFSAIGLYPEITAVGGFVIGSPLFSAVTLTLPSGHALQIDATGAADNHPFVQSLTLDGVSTTNLWIPWGRVQNGANLNFSLGAAASSWGANPQDAPPSFPPHA